MGQDVTTTRHPDWDRRLIEFIAERDTWTFEWGKNDCCLFAADAVEAITGIDVVPELRGRYSTQLGAARLLKKVTDGTVKGMAEQALEASPIGCHPIERGYVRRGDVVLVAGLQGPALAVCTGQHMAVPGDEGLVMVQRSAVLRAWRI